MTDTAPQIDLLGSPYREVLTTQSYDSIPAIEGCQVIDLRLHSDEGGDFCEIGRFLADGALAELPDFRPAQLSYSVMEPGAIKAWHLHLLQDDLWFVPAGNRVLVGLLDTRADSPTYQQSMRLAMGAGTPRLLFIPHGVAHGVANLGSAPAGLVYFVNRGFDARHPDEHRLPYDLLGADFWSIRPG